MALGPRAGSKRGGAASGEGRRHRAAIKAARYGRAGHPHAAVAAGSEILQQPVSGKLEQLLYLLHGAPPLEDLE